MSRKQKANPLKNPIVAGSILILALLFIASITTHPTPTTTTATPQPSGTPSGGIYDVPVIGQVAQAVKAVGDALGNALQLSTVGGDVGIGAVIGYTSTSGESQVFTEWRYSGVLFSGVGVLDPMAGIHVRPDNPKYKALKLYDPDTGAEGDIWFQPILAVKVYNGTPVSHNFTVATKAVIQCDNGYTQIISYSRQGRSGIGAPDKIQFDKHSVKGSAIHGHLTSAMARGGAMGKNAATCKLFLMVDYDGQILFQGDEEPVRKSLSNVVLGVFEVRRVVPSGDFEFQLSSNATVRPIAEVMVGGQGGVSQPITFTETRIQISTQSGTTITQTQTIVRTQTIQIITTQTVVKTETKYVTVTAGGSGSVHPGMLVETPRGLVAARDLRIGDEVYVFDGKLNKHVGVVVNKKVVKTDHYLHIVLGDSELVVDGEQPVRTVSPVDGYTKAKYLRVGDVVATTGGPRRITGIWREEVDGVVIDFALSPYTYYSANGVLVEDALLKSGVLIQVPYNEFVFSPHGTGWYR